MKTVCVLGASGYTGRELARLLGAHPALRLDGFFSARPGGAPEPPALESERAAEPLDWKRVQRCAGAFLCTPHGASAELAVRCLELGLKVVDLSADFRLRDAPTHRRVYERDHPAPEWLERAVYGLTEHAREDLARARLVANPGCYPTAVLLPLLPLLGAGLLDERAAIVADAKSGVSGAGKTPTARTHFGNVHDNFLAYSVGHHRHAPEIHQQAGTDRIVFVPHLLPVFRGLLATIYVTPRRGRDADDLRQALAEAYAGEPFVRVFQSGLPELAGVVLTNQCHVGVAACGPQVVLVSVLDNLVKGAAGQALQNMNRLLDLPEGAGLA